LPPCAGELLPESEIFFFERLSGMPMTFSRDARGKVTGLTAHYQDNEFSYEKISDQPPKAPEPLKQRIQKRYKITIREATADRGYGSAAIIRSLQEAGTTTYIPLWSGRVGNSKYLKGKLVYDRKRDWFRCPRVKYLTPNPAICGNQKRYVSSSADCQRCPQRSICPTEAKKKLLYKRYVRRSIEQDLFEEVQTRMEEAEFRKKLSERMWKAEGLSAEAKQNHCLARARYRGRSKVQIQAYLSAMA
jgi:hypothetical protein